LPGLSVRPLAALECHATNASTGFSGTASPANSQTDDAGGCDTFEPTGRLGVLGILGEFSAFAGVGRYVRVPTLAELYGTSVVVRGNPRLESETGVTFDAGTRFTHRLDGEVAPLFAALAAYTRQSKELVSFVRTAQGYVVPVNVGETRITGLELEAGAGFLRHFSADGALTALDARDRTPGLLRKNDILPYRPRLTTAAGVRVTSGPTGYRFAEKLTLGTRFLYWASSYADFAGLAVIPEQHTLDLDGSMSALEGALTLRARVVNVLDSARFDVVGFPLPGRSVFVSLEARL
jgi:iron complex outermembrane receptor protein